MHKRFRSCVSPGRARRISTLARALSLAAVGATTAFAISGLGAASAAASEGTVWLCKPGLASNPCLSSQEATVIFGNGASFVQHAQPAEDPPIDCFYVYPTVSSQFSENANLEIDPEQDAIAIAQASRFSQDCKVYAPVYPQLTIPALLTPGGITSEGVAKAYMGVLSAWQEYLAKYNHGRGVVLIGHSQGSAMLIRLIREQIDPNLVLRNHLVSAVLLGGQVIVPEGKTVGGSFKHVPACEVAWETSCVVAYSSFLKEPPNPSNFGRPESPVSALNGGAPGVSDPQVLCVNPTLPIQNGGEGPLFPYYGTSPFPGLLGPAVQVPTAPTPWVSAPHQYNARCMHQNGASWLQLNYVGPPGDPREQLKETLGPAWGTHLVDINVALGNLVALVHLQGLVYSLGHGF
jgi:hypothetical protein